MMEWSSRMVNCCNVMVNCMVGSRCNMEGRGVVGDCHWMDGCGMVEGSGMVSNSMVRSGVVNNPVVRVSVSHHWDGVAVLVEDGLGQVRVEQGVGVEAVEGDGRAAVDCVPELTPEQVLIEECSVGADKAGSLGSVSSVVADAIRLTARFRVSVHAGGEGDGGAAELSVGRVGMARVIHAGVSNCPVLIVFGLVVRLRLMVGSRRVIGCGCHHRGMIGWGRWGIWCWLMVDWRGWGIRGRLMIDWRRWGVGGRLMVGRRRGGIRSWCWW